MEFYALEGAGEKPVFPNMARNYKADVTFTSYLAVLEVDLHSESHAGSGQALVFLSVFVGRECSQSAKAAPSTVGRKRTQIKMKKKSDWYSYSIGLWLVGSWLRPESPEASS